MEELTQEPVVEQMAVFGLDREMVVIQDKHAKVITDFIEQHRVRGLIIKQNAIEVAASIVDMETAQAAAGWIRERNAEKSDIVKGPLGFWRNLFHKAHQATKDVEKLLTAPYEESVAIVDTRIGVIHTEERKRQAEIQRKAQEDLRKREEDLRLQAAQKLAERGQTEAADRVLERPMVIQAPIMQAPKIDKMRTTRTLTASCNSAEDQWKFFKWVMETGPTNAYLISINMKEVAALAKKQDASFAFPGITLQWEESRSYGNQRRVGE